MADENVYGQNLTLDEIVFENRNKEYGAYDLRHQYPRLLTKSFIIGTALFLLAALSPFIYLTIKNLTAPPKQEVKADLVEIIEDEPIIDQPKEEEPPPPPPPPKEEEKIEVIQNVVPEPVKAPKIETPPPPISKQLETQTGLQNQEGVKAPAYTPPPPPPSTGTKASTVEVKANNPNEIYKDVDQSAEYPGGMGALRKFLGDNFDTSLMEGGEGTLKAKLKFVVEKDGTVSNVTIEEKSPNGDFNSEAMRVVKKLKKWTPAKRNGESVRSYYSVPFTMNFE
ncbi:TonB family protein [Chryseobacterium arthrosphaerae]|uniref:Energy transducer TonB n=1 Tax=Chryseobacterium arthrosphaerae TaxID=651561 RepID=A0A1B8ZV88_9FLAO|nr:MULTISPECIES: energy transducer TonB [Chryseobacterium]AYZ13948.1 TonB family protein [Chryseobacterium arthrosphaerae]MDG4654076.1 TonB family protein [Chryseobacterium arthrosphaerae]OCA75505.1 energy transducer TonB [Chryseobacterium arthrosphaerae]QUY54769.1 TonB family protein [Chryseobacterium arthrosphaerae]RTZ50036.1 TonB family protein [Chryseobacterium arthrosphaerae]